MGAHMKTTIDIADDLLLRAKKRAKARNTTLRRVIEQALAENLDKQSERVCEPPKMIVTDGDGMTGEFQSAGWDRIRDAIYGTDENPGGHRS